MCWVTGQGKPGGVVDHIGHILHSEPAEIHPGDVYLPEFIGPFRSLEVLCPSLACAPPCFGPVARRQEETGSLEPPVDGAGTDPTAIASQESPDFPMAVGRMPTRQLMDTLPQLRVKLSATMPGAIGFRAAQAAIVRCP